MKEIIDLFGKSENFFASLQTLRLCVKINECACAFWAKTKRKDATFFSINYFPENFNE